MSNAMGTKIVVRRRQTGWRWYVVVVEECLRSGNSPTWRKARADARAAMDAWLAEAWKMCVPSRPLTVEQKKLVKRFGGFAD